ncbi:hypothetical protein C8J57DRAFT_630355 [Mycena rebaudengoi]|nr:hypothetical protein C8J57DRAFT_630355 [Mycena rebaudengoi]
MGSDFSSSGTLIHLGLTGQFPTRSGYGGAPSTMLRNTAYSGNRLIYLSLCVDRLQNVSLTPFISASRSAFLFYFILGTISIPMVRRLPAFYLRCVDHDSKGILVSRRRDLTWDIYSRSKRDSAISAAVRRLEVLVVAMFLSTSAAAAQPLRS